MKSSVKTILFVFGILFTLNTSNVQAAPDPNALLERMDYILRGDTHEMKVAFTVKTTRWERNYTIKVWMKGVDFAFARILAPPKVEGQGFLRIKARLWNYLPAAERTLLIPPSMMLDQFLGSDFSNDDFVKLSYLPRDYDAAIAGEEVLGDAPAYHLVLTPHPDAPVTYGKLELWLRQTDAMPVRMDFFNEKLELIRTLHYSNYRRFGDHEIPSMWRMENHKRKDHETLANILEAAYNVEIPDSVFRREHLERYP